MLREAAIVGSLLVLSTLHGCGGSGQHDGGSNASSTASPSTRETTSATTTTTTTHANSAPLNGAELAKLMNQEYNGYTEEAEESPYGVYLRNTDDMTIYCKRGSCWLGTPDCRISGSLFNYKSQMDINTGHLSQSFGKLTSWYVNTSLVRTKLNKCTYAWDGNTNGKVNSGCGCHQDPSGKTEDCDNPCSPFNNKVPEGNPPTCTKSIAADSPNLARCACSGMDQRQWPVTWDQGARCFWKGPAFFPASGATKDETRQMIEWRNNHQENFNELKNWNEMVLDGDLLLEEMAYDAVATIPAIVYLEGGKDHAKSMAQQMAHEWGGPVVPVIKLNDRVDVRSGNAEVFVFEEEEHVLVTSV